MFSLLNTKLKKVCGLLLLACFSSVVLAQPVAKYFADDEQFAADIITPEQVLGFGLGERHVRHDQLINYLMQLAQTSDNLTVTNMGYTNEYRQQLLLTFSSPKNIKNLSTLLAERQNFESGKHNKLNVVWLGYSVHGDEISGANAAIAIAYYLAASKALWVKQMLENTLVVMEPSINPDGMDRFSQWVNMFRGSIDNDDPNHIEHHQHWPTGRTNHYMFDLNRDWLLLTQQETQNRMAFYHQYQPNVLADFHEMGANSTYFFQPGVPTRTNPLTDIQNITLTNQFAEFHAKALDDKQSLYFSKESFDDFYYGKGSTYPDINGAVGILFEQASSRGLMQQTENGLLTFTAGISNHIATSLSTLKGAWQHRKALAEFREQSYQTAFKLAQQQNFTGYLVHEPNNPARLNKFLATLAGHQIKAYPLTQNYKDTSAKGSYFIPLKQAQYRVIRALFDRATEFKDNTFYDVSGWTLPLAFNINSQKVKSSRGLTYSKQPWHPIKTNVTNKVAENAYAYIVNWQNDNTAKLLYQLTQQGIRAKFATQAFSAKTLQGEQLFSAGSIVINAGIQHQANWQTLLFNKANELGITVHSISSGLTPKGIDLGSRSMVAIKPVKALLIGGKKVSQYEAGELLFYANQSLDMPLTVVEQARLKQVNLNQYSHILMVDGNYNGIEKAVVNNIKAWLKNGGVIYAQKGAAKWLAAQQLLAVKYQTNKVIEQAFPAANTHYGEQDAIAAKKRIAGAIFNTQLDLANPLAYGFDQPNLPVFLNTNALFEIPQKGYLSLASLTKNSRLSGYVSDEMSKIIANHPVVIAHNVGKGKIVASNAVLAFRGYWPGTAKILANTLFFANALKAKP